MPRQLRHPQLPRREDLPGEVGIGAAILPWNSPLRVVEKAIMLDQISGGRTFSDGTRPGQDGIRDLRYPDGRGPRPLQRGRTDGDVGVQSGIVEGDGPMYPQKRAVCRPAPSAGVSWEGRLFGAAMSPDTVPIIAQMGLQMMTFMQFPFEKHAEIINTWKQHFRDAHHTEPGPPVIQDFVICHEDEEEGPPPGLCAHQPVHFCRSSSYYDFAGKHWRETKGYETYQAGADMIREAGWKRPPTPMSRPTSTAPRSRSSRSTPTATR